MSALVVDSSAALAWCFADEFDTAAEALLERVSKHGACVPALWRWEIANGLVTAVRRARIDAERAFQILQQLEGLPIDIDAASEDAALTATFTIAVATGLTAYDASYLELAERLDLPLATRDARMKQAASARGVPLA